MERKKIRWYLSLLYFMRFSCEEIQGLIVYSRISFQK